MTQDDDLTAHLLRLAGPRRDVPADRAARVRDAVRLQWHAGRRRRAIRRRTFAVTTLLVTAAAIALFVKSREAGDHTATPSGITVATVERIEGNLRPGTPLSPGNQVRTDEWVETDAAVRAALRLGDGSSLRLDTSSRARLLAPTVIELSRGALYLDTGADSSQSTTTPGFEVRTPLGTAYDIGTQFEVRLEESSVRIRVRTGLVELRRGERSIAARPGTELNATTGDVVARTVPAFGPEWDWAAKLAPAFEIEGRSVSGFLEYLSREHGWTLRYADAGLAREASGIILHGSVAGLEPREALAVALATSGLQHRFRNGELVVFRTANPL